MSPGREAARIEAERRVRVESSQLESGETPRPSNSPGLVVDRSERG